MPFVDEEEPSRFRIPYLHYVTSIPRGNVAAVRRPGQCIYHIVVPIVCEEEVPFLCIQHVYPPITATSSDVVAIGRPGHRIHGLIIRISEGEDSRLYIPHLHSVIPTTRGDVAAIGRPGQRRDDIFVPCIGTVVGPGVDIPHLYGIVPAAGGEIAAIGRPGQGIHDIAMLSVNEERCSQWMRNRGIDIARSEEQYQGQHQTCNQGAREYFLEKGGKRTSPHCLLPGAARSTSGLHATAHIHPISLSFISQRKCSRKT